MYVTELVVPEYGQHHAGKDHVGLADHGEVRGDTLAAGPTMPEPR